MKIFITGGCKNGKSFYAQEVIHKLAGWGEKFYIATMAPTDSEDKERIRRHRKDRQGMGFITVEQSLNIRECLDICDSNSSVLFDSTTALLSNEMFLRDGTVNFDAADKIIAELLPLCRRVKHIALVSDWMYSDAMRYEDLTDTYRRSLAKIDCALAKEADAVCEVSFGRRVFHKGEECL